MKSFEDVLAFSQLEQYLTDEEKNRIASSMGMSVDEIRRRMSGKKKEDEFILILLFMDVCKELSGFDEGLSKLGEQTYTSDLIVELKRGDKFLLEIKHTDKKRYAISSGNLQKRIDYANSLGLELYFAISIKGFWMLFKSDYMQTKQGKIDVTDWNNSVLDDLLGTSMYLFPPKMKIRSVYSSSRDDGIGIHHPDYGSLISYELYYDGRKIFRVKGKHSPYIGYSMLLEALEDRLSSENQEVLRTGDITVVTEYDDGAADQDKEKDSYNFISEYLFLLAPVLHTAYGVNGERLEADGIINAMKSDVDILRFPKEYIRGMMRMLVDLGVPLMYVYERNIYKLQGIKGELTYGAE